MALNTFEEKRLFNRATENPEKKISDYINKSFVCKDYMMRSAVIHDEDGNEKQVIQTIFVDTDGVGILSNSMGVAKSLLSIIAIFGDASEWGFDGLELEVKEINFKGGRYFKVLVK